MIADAWQLLYDRLLFLDFRIEHSQRIRINAPLAVRPELVFHLQQLRAKQLDVFRPAFAAANRIHAELNTLQLQLFEKSHHHFDDLGVDRGSIGAPEHFRANPLLKQSSPCSNMQKMQFPISSRP